MKRGDENELERKIKLERVVTNKHLRLACRDGKRKKSKTGECCSYQMAQFGHVDGRRKKTRLEKMIATKRLKLAMEMDKKRKARLEKMVATTQLRLAFETEEERRAKNGLDLIWIYFGLRLEF